MMANILVVDDEAFIRMYLEEVLADEGHEVHSARDGAEALTLLQEGARPDLILLDLMMPRMSGWEFRNAQSTDPALAAIPVVLLSGAGDVQAEARRMGVAGYVTKPFLPAHLLQAIERAAAA
jgi:two-component system response regulator MprA